MKILIVINNFHMTGNGMAASARCTVKYLKEAGHEVRVLAGPNPDYWLSHPKERWETGQQYVQAMKAYDIRQSIAKLTALFERAIREKSSSN